MEPNNFEEDFREKLNQRKIEPSSKAWDRLDAMLSVAEEKKPEKSRKWLYIAASFIGFILVGTFFFNQKGNTIESPKNVVVEKGIRKDSVEKPLINTGDSIKTEIAISENPSKETYQEEKKPNQQTNILLQNKSNQIAESSVIIKNNQEQQSTNNNQTVIAENPKKENIDQLLETAENKVIADNASKTKKAKVKINAADLLNQVDGELELSFREKVITKVNKNFQEVKVALSNRNKQE
ncbi:hypothetical protein J0383_06645 [Flavobacterium endoglycinae]|uniref:Anti-sigma factor n=1 Tax=Flavobacterium endoglycinae TaxID=2816357 RepID=A0ABX7QHC9_9FLAO|nr:hypothetical protein [Flavobacterium endoglycinae]QSW90482.1 hypothetical protein J0383_06645 [Flavobacterium endoglycinae]